jgi:UTP--glucose-1-phosphate uridylyltransferase
MKTVRKAVLPVAGLGTRVLPGAKTTPKEMLNVFDRPILSYIVAEARAAGIEHFVFVTGRGKGAIEDYFDHHVELEAQLEAKGKADILADVRADLPKPGEMSFVRQMAPLGLGHAVWCARDIVGDEPFAVILPDMLMQASPPTLAQAIAAHDAVGGNIIVVEPAPAGEAHKYGIVALAETAAGFDGRLARMVGMVEKPAPGTEPSNLFISGRYILQPDIFKLLSDQQAGAGGEIQLTDAMVRLMGEGQDFHALTYDGITYDCGDKIGLLRANVAFALSNPAFAADARAAIEALLQRPGD